MNDPVLACKGLCFAYPNGTVAVTDVDISFPGHALTVVAGPNGSGKTALLRLLAGLLEPDAGTILFDNKPIQGMRRGYCAHVACVFQNADAQFLGDTALDDVMFGPLSLGKSWKDAQSDALEALFSCGLCGFESRFAHELSGGERRRLAIAGILAMKPDVVLLDEPFANLDWPSVRGVVRIVASLVENGKSVVLATHEIEKILGLAKHFVALGAGKLVFSGPPSGLSGMDFERFGLRNPYHGTSTLAGLSWED